MLIISEREVPGLLPMAECIEVMSRALATLARGGALMPLRTMLHVPPKAGILAMMPAYLGEPDALGVKVITVFNGNHGTAYDSHQGAVLLFGAEHGDLIAVIDASSVTAIRTAAVSGLATRLLAREDAGDLCILGSGVQARTHLEAVMAVRSVHRVRVWSRTPHNARVFADAAASACSVPIEVMPDVESAAAGADIICATTSARDPILHGEWIASGAHVNAVGSSTPTAREIDTNGVVRASLFVDKRESTLRESGDFLVPRGEGAIGDDHIRAELGEVVIGSRAGRTSRDEITLFKSLGLAVEDVAAAHHIYAGALRMGVGTRVELGGRRLS